MASYFNLTLDTTAPGGVSISINAGATYATSRDVTANIATTDASTTGYQMKIWGDVDGAANASIQPLEANSVWIAYNTAQAVRLSTGDGVKTLNLRVRDDVYNEAAAVSDTITLDTSLPVITISGPDVSKISKITGKRTASFSFSADAAIVEWKVKAVPSTASLHDAGTVIPITNGSTNMTGAALAAATTVNGTIDGADLETASPGDGAKVIKVFGRDDAGNWSV